jgi:hypothetical protein
MMMDERKKGRKRRSGYEEEYCDLKDEGKKLCGPNYQLLFRRKF